DGHRPLLVRKIRNILLNLVIQLQPAFVQQQANCSRREYDGGGSGSKPVTGRNRRAVLDIRKPKTLRPHDLAIDTDGDREPRQVVLGHARAHDLAGLLRGSGPLWWR